MSAPASPPNAAPPVPADPAGLDTANAKDRLESASNGKLSTKSLVVGDLLC
jgi:hypothetical protein